MLKGKEKKPDVTHTYTHKMLVSVWSAEKTKELMREVWSSTIKWMKGNGFSRADEKGMAAIVPEPSGHEVVDALNEFIADTGLVNAHAGLTSSDVIDNVRLMQCNMSMFEVKLSLDALVKAIRALAYGCESIACVGYTHWQVASITNWANRLHGWEEVFEDIGSHAPEVRAKKVGGAVGDRRAIHTLCSVDSFEEDPAIGGMECPWKWGIQSSYHIDELRQAQWLCEITAWCHKVAQDIRFLCHTGEMTTSRTVTHRGSSAMPGKNNPIEAEQICSLARLQPGYARAIWDVMALNGLERTLDGSAALRVTLPAMYNNAGYIVEKLSDLFHKVTVDQTRCLDILSNSGDRPFVEEILAGKIAAGATRFDAYEEMSKSGKI